MVVIPSELLGPEQGVGEIDEQTHGHEPRERIVEGHGRLLEPVAGIDVADRHREEGDAEGDHDDVHHGNVSEQKSGTQPANSTGGDATLICVKPDQKRIRP
jgi:hypothetical protein